jgi:hypothetical protein
MPLPLAISRHASQQRVEDVDVQIGYPLLCVLAVTSLGTLNWQFGTGWIHGKVLLSQLVTNRIVRTRFACGWGFGRSSRGMHCDRGGTLALEIRCRDGKRLRLGATRAHELQLFIERARGRRH